MKQIIVITGPSGIGKTHLAGLLQRKHPHKIREAKLITTRAPRLGEAKNADRIFTSTAVFQQRIDSGEVGIYGTFHGQRYGYLANDLLANNDQHIIMNTWPALVPQFSRLEESIIIGLTISTENVDLLEERMHNRGDSKQKIEERIPLIKEDIKELSEFSNKLRAQDKVFTIYDNSSLQNEVIPWIEKKLGLQADG